MLPDADPGPAPARVLSIPEIRDYQRINAELVGLLDAGHPMVRLEGAEGQRLLASGLSGPWEAVIEIEGRTGPELAADLDAPGLTIVARGPSADGAGRTMRSGRVLILGDAGDATGYGQSGGVLVVAGSAGPRAGLAQSGGILIVLGRVGRLPADRQAGGVFFAKRGQVGPHPGRGRRGGRLVELPADGPVDLDPGDAEAFRSARASFAPWIDPTSWPLA